MCGTSTLFVCVSDVDVNEETYQCSRRFFELMEVVDDAEKNKARERYSSCVRECDIGIFTLQLV